MAFQCDLSHLPLVIYHLNNDGHGDDNPIDASIRSLEELFARRHKFATLAYLKTTRADAGQRKRYAEWESGVRDLFRAYHVGAGIVVYSGVVLGAMTALRWLAPAPYPEFVTRSPINAAEFCVGALERAEVDVSRPKAYLDTLRRSKGTSAT